MENKDTSNQTPSTDPSDSSAGDINLADNINKEEKTAKTEEMVTVKKDKLKSLIDRLERLESAASKAGLSRYDQAHKDTQKKTIQLLTFEGKVIVRWAKLLKNVVEKNTITGHWEEDQQIELEYEDEKKEKMPYVIFSRRYQKLKATVNKEIMNYDEDEERDGKLTFVVKSIDGKEYKIGSKFVN